MTLQNQLCKQWMEGSRERFEGAYIKDVAIKNSGRSQVSIQYYVLFW